MSNMNWKNHDDLMNAERLTVMPDFKWTCTGTVRGVIRPDGSPYLEMLYRDNFYRPFWGPLPLFRVPAPPKVEKKWWQKIFSKAEL